MIIVANQGHAEDWLRLRKQVYTTIDDDFHLREMELWLSDPQRLCLLALDDAEAVAFLEASLRNIVDGCLSSPVGYVEGIYVAPAQRGQGLARRLLVEVQQWMRRQGCMEIATDAELANDQAVAFHRAMGFSETYRIVEFKKSLVTDDIAKGSHRNG